MQDLASKPTTLETRTPMAAKRRSVLVTGASSGIGRAAAIALAARGYRVFAGVRRERDAASLRAHSGSVVQPVMLDVTDDSSIQDALNTVALEALSDSMRRELEPFDVQVVLIES
jgi:nucleoside-diphosphate-sugar epimerase